MTLQERVERMERKSLETEEDNTENLLWEALCLLAEEIDALKTGAKG